MANDSALASPASESGRGAAVAPEAPSTVSADGSCYPTPAFAERLCQETFPGVALILFGKASPWARAYLKGPSKAWTTAPAAQAEEQLFFREEVLVLQDQKAPSGGVQVSSGASFYALRWNGSCVKLTEEEVTDQPPWQKITPPLNWGWLDDNIQEALRQDRQIDASVTRMKKACRGARMGNQPAPCKAAEKQLTDAIVNAVRGGFPLPDPTRLP